jgi:serine protease Do
MDSTISQTFRTVVISLLIGGTSGVVAGAVTSDALTTYALQLAELARTPRLSQARPVYQVLSGDDVLGVIEEDVLPGVVDVYAGSGVLDTAIAHGIALTSDGWMVVKIPTNISAASLRYVIGRQAYVADKTVYDTVTGMTFVHIAERNLPVVAFGELTTLPFGARVYVLSSVRAVAQTSVYTTLWSSSAVSSDLPSRRLVLSETVETSAMGAPVTDEAGNLIGFVSGTDTDGRAHVMAIESVLPAFTSVLREGEITRASLGLMTVDLAHVVALPAEARDRSQGAWVQTAAAIKKGSAAETAGLKAGDIILSVDGILVDENHSLDELILPRAPGDRVLLHVDREGEVSEIDLQATLGAL